MELGASSSSSPSCSSPTSSAPTFGRHHPVSSMKKFGRGLTFKRQPSKEKGSTEGSMRVHTPSNEETGDDALETLDGEYSIVDHRGQFGQAQGSGKPRDERAGSTSIERSRRMSIEKPLDHNAPGPSRRRISSSNSTLTPTGLAFPSAGGSTRITDTSHGPAKAQPPLRHRNSLSSISAIPVSFNARPSSSASTAMGGTSFKAATISSPVKRTTAGHPAAGSLVRKMSSSSLAGDASITGMRKPVSTNNGKAAQPATRRISGSHNTLPSLASTSATTSNTRHKAASSISALPTPSSTSHTSPIRRSASTLVNNGGTASRIPAAKGSKSALPTSRLAYASATPRPAAATASSRPRSRLMDLASSDQTGGGLDDSPGLEVLVANTTVQMADLAEMLSPLASIKTAPHHQQTSRRGEYSASREEDADKENGGMMKQEEEEEDMLLTAEISLRTDSSGAFGEDEDDAGDESLRASPTRKVGTLSSHRSVLPSHNKAAGPRNAALGANGLPLAPHMRNQAGAQTSRAKGVSTDLADLLSPPAPPSGRGPESPLRSSASMRSDLSSVSLTPFKAPRPSHTQSQSDSADQDVEEQHKYAKENADLLARLQEAEAAKEALALQLSAHTSEAQQLRRLLAAHSQDAARLSSLESALSQHVSQDREVASLRERAASCEKEKSRKERQEAHERASRAWEGVEAEMWAERGELDLQRETLRAVEGLVMQLPGYIRIVAERQTTRQTVSAA